jgi:hypothetical protein
MSARQSNLQPDNADPLVGLKVNLPRQCPRGHDTLHVSPGRGPHRASLQCARCGRHCGWLSHKVAKFLCDVIGRFGKPIAPVRVRVPRTTPPTLCIVDNGKASTNASALVIETAITDNAPPFNQPWPPTGLGDGWHAVDKFSSRQRTFWRRIRLEYARQSPRVRDPVRGRHERMPPWHFQNVRPVEARAFRC